MPDNMESLDNRIILIYPWGNPLPKSSGIEKRTSMLISLFRQSGQDIVVIAPVLIFSRDLHAEKFFSYKGHGGLLIDLNPTYYYTLIKLLKNSGKNQRLKIVLTGPLGIFGAFLTKILFHSKREVLVVYDAHNVERLRLSQRSVSVSGLSAPFLVTKVIFLISEWLATKLVDLIFSVSWNDKTKFVMLYNLYPEKIKVVPSNISSGISGRSSKSYRQKKLSKPLCVFHGTYNYLPNKEAVNIIIQEVAPRVPEAYFLIAGKGIPKGLDNVPSNVQLVGFVEDLDEFLASCDIAVVPLKKGAGTKLKIYDYMKAGLGIVTTRKGSEGICLIHEKNALIFDNPDQAFIEGIKKLIYNPKLKRKLGHRAFKMSLNTSSMKERVL